jgi:hypothetical protein
MTFQARPGGGLANVEIGTAAAILKDAVIRPDGPGKQEVIALPVVNGRTI